MIIVIAPYYSATLLLKWSWFVLLVECPHGLVHRQEEQASARETRIASPAKLCQLLGHYFVHRVSLDCSR